MRTGKISKTFAVTIISLDKSQGIFFYWTLHLGMVNTIPKKYIKFILGIASVYNML